jgi:hypothetical protein
MISNDSLTCAFAPGKVFETPKHLPRSGGSDDPAEPKASFVRGVAVGLGLVAPAWAWVIVSVIR